MNRLYLVRHGESVVNVTREFSYKKVDKGLTEKGILQAEQTADYFRDLQKETPIHALYSSPLKRAAETAAIIGDAVGLEPVIMENFREVNVGDMEDLPPTPENWQIFIDIIQEWAAGNPAKRFPGGEDYHTLADRMLSGVAEVMNGHDGENIIIVAHGGIMSFALHDLCPGLDPAVLYAAPAHNCSVGEVLAAMQDGRPIGELVRWADAGHLHGEAAEFEFGVAGDFFDE